MATKSPIYHVTEGDIPSCLTALQDGLYIARTDIFGEAEILPTSAPNTALKSEMEALNKAHWDSNDSYWLVHANKGVLRHAIYGEHVSPNHPRVDDRARAWIGCDIIALSDIDDDALPDHVELCTIMAEDAPRLGARMGESLYAKNTFIFTPYYDDGDVSCAIESRGGTRVLRQISSEALGHIVGAQRRAVLRGDIPSATIAWQSESAQGLIEIERDLSGLEPSEGDPHMVWSYTDRGDRLDLHIEPVWARIWSAVEAFR